MKRGFTLVELLAVIVVLAIILVIAVPKINNEIKLSKEKTFINSAKSVVRQLEYMNIEEESFDEKSLNEIDIELSNIDYDKENSKVYYENEKITLDLVGKNKYEGMYLCKVNSYSSNETFSFLAAYQCNKNNVVNLC